VTMGACDAFRSEALDQIKQYEIFWLDGATL
jgi:signal recognition particle GTPase